MLSQSREREMRLERREEPKRRKLKMRGRQRINKRKSDCANPASGIKKSIRYTLHSLASYCVVSSGPSTSSTSKSVAYQFPSPQSSGHAPQSQMHSPNLSNWHSALYQLHLVKSEIAKALIPKEFRLVEAFGFTLGGFFLASYDDSPAGVFDELVVIAGIVWNRPTSCAWAAKVVVSSNEACQHGRDNVGLPSHVASFSKVGRCSEQRIIGTKGQQEGKANGFLNMIGMDSARFAAKTPEATRVTEMNGPAASDIFSINLIRAAPSQNTRLWKGPLVRMSLPSFSGRTEYNPSLLKYSCQMKCRVRVVRPLNVSEEPLPSSDVETELKGHAANIAAMSQSTIGVDAGDEQKENRSHLSLSVMLSRPILALEFSCMEMNVEAPLIISQ